MNKRALRADLLLLLTSCIWGFGFAAQRSGMKYVGPFTFNGIRFLLGSLSLLPLIIYRRGKTGAASSGYTGGWGLFRSSLAAGSCLFIAVSLQQTGMLFTTAGNAGFITGFYVVLTPIFGIFLGRKTGLPTWIGAMFTLAGLYFLSAAGHPDRINPGDIINAIGAVFWAVHVLLIDALVRHNDPIRLSAAQFAWCGLYALIAALFIEPFMSGWARYPGMIASGLFDWKSLPALISAFRTGSFTGASAGNALIPLLYGGFAAVGIAYTLQAAAQRDAPPAHAVIILCLEGCFAAIGGVLILSEPLGHWTLPGFAMMLSGMLISQWEVIARGVSRGSARSVTQGE
jgi:drug/metabolite transporter (DMT)-like permease